MNTITEEAINRVYFLQEASARRMHRAAEDALAKKQDYESKLLAGLMDGSIAGKNQTERDAAARQVLAAEYAAMVDAEQEERAAKLEYDIACLEVARVRALLRLAEMEASREA